MKIRRGFVSNSSSTSFVLDITDIPKEILDKIKRMANRTNHDCSRCTGVIWDLGSWCSQFEGDYDWLADDYNNDHTIMVRESDEEMGGSFSDYGFCANDLKPYVVYEFEFH